MTSTSTKNTTTDYAVPPEVLDAVGKMRSPIVISHVVPDADALGSMFAVARVLSADGCRVRASLPQGSLSKRLQFMFDWADVTVASPDDFAQADGFIVLDTAKRPRANVGPNLRDQDWSAGRPVINIDHHATNTNFGNVNWVNGGAGSTCELVYQLFRAGDHTMDATTASLLFAGIQTDTLGFSLATTGADAFRAAAALVDCGARVAELGERLFRSQSQAEFNLLRIIYANTKVAAGGHVSYSSADYEEINNAGCTAADIDEQINVPRSLDGVRLSMLFTEGVKGRTRINFRSSGHVTIVELAERFAGGGHQQAAGAIILAPVAKAIEQVLPAAIEHLTRFD